jgi:hypothetical protein
MSQPILFLFLLQNAAYVKEQTAQTASKYPSKYKKWNWVICNHLWQ